MRHEKADAKLKNHLAEVEQSIRTEELKRGLGLAIKADAMPLEERKPESVVTRYLQQDPHKWQEMQSYFPGGDKITKIVEMLAYKACEPGISVEDAVSLSDACQRLLREFVRGVYAIKTESVKKPPQVNVQNNLDMSRFPIIPAVEQRASRARTKKAQATNGSAASATPSGSSDHEATSHPDSAAEAAG